MKEHFHPRNVKCTSIRVEYTSSAKVERYIFSMLSFALIFDETQKNLSPSFPGVKYLPIHFSSQLNSYFMLLHKFIVVSALSLLAGSLVKKRTASDHKTLHAKTMSEEDEGTLWRRQQPYYQAKTSDRPGFILFVCFFKK